jgi:hypothetical protein
MLNYAANENDFLFPLSKGHEYYLPYIPKEIADKNSYDFASSCCFYAHLINVNGAGGIAALCDALCLCGVMGQQSVLYSASSRIII